MITNSYKSSPLIEDNPKTQRSSKTSKRSSKQRNSNDYEWQKVVNPFHSKDKQNYLPAGLMQQIGELEYITPHQVQTIAWQQAVFVPRRSSVFTKHLQAMQKAAKQQFQKSKPMINTLKKVKVCFQDMQQEEEQKSISIEENDGLSLGMRNCFGYDNNMQNQEMNFEEQIYEEPSIHFYSLNSISEQGDMLDQFDDYFNP